MTDLKWCFFTLGSADKDETERSGMKKTPSVLRVSLDIRRLSYLTIQFLLDELHLLCPCPNPNDMKTSDLKSRFRYCY